MNKDNIIRVALCQRICPDFRVPVWTRLAKRDEIELTLFHGKGTNSGSTSSTSQQLEFNNHCLATVTISKGSRYRVLHPGLIYRVMKGKFNIVILEGLTYFPNSLLLALICKIFRKPFILYEAPPVGDESFLRKLVSPLYRFLSSGIITYNSYGLEYYRRKGYPRDRITVALNTIDTEQVRGRMKLFSGERAALIEQLDLKDCLIVGYIGALEKRKQPCILMDSVIQLSNRGIRIKVIFIGDGPERNILEDKIPENMKKYISFVGRHVDDAERYLQLCSVVVLPSQGGLAIPHALTCGIPCIATEEAEGPGIRDYIEDGINGYILSGDIEKELQKKLGLLCENSERLEELRKGAIVSRKRFEISGMVESITRAVKTVYQNYYIRER